MRTTHRKSNAVIASVLSALMLIGGVLGVSVSSAYAEEVPSGTYTTVAFAAGDHGFAGEGIHNGAIGIKRNGEFFALGACVETDITAPTGTTNYDAEYKNQAGVRKPFNKASSAGKTPTDAEFESIKRIIYIYSEKPELINSYFENATYGERGKYEATWAAIAQIACGVLPPFVDSDWENKDAGYGDRKGAYEYLLNQSSSVEVPSGLELAFFQNPQEAYSGGSKSQTLVALKLYGPDGPGIKNTTVTAKVGTDSSTATDSAAATASLDGTNSASLSDKIELNNLDSTKSYKIVTGIYKVSGSTGTLVSGSEQTIDVASTDIDTSGAVTKTVTFSKTLTDEGTYTIVTKLYESSVSDANLKATHNGDFSKKSETVDVESSAPSIGTTVSAAGETASETAECNITAEEAEALTEVKDEIAYKKLIPSAKKYDITAELYEVKNGAIVGSAIAKATAQETSDASGNGTWTVTIPLGSKKLEPGKSYVVYETVVYSVGNDEPASSPYDKKMEHKDPTDKAQIIVVGNYPPVDIKISKNVLGGSEVAGAKMKLSGGPNDISESWTSTASAKEFSVVPGEYTLVEEVAPAGLKKVTTTMKFTVKSDGTVELKTTSVNNGGKLSVKEVDGVKNNIVLEDAPIEPDLVKTVNGGKSASVLSADDVVGFEITAKIPYGVTKDYTITDKLPKPLIYIEDSLSVLIDGTNVLKEGAYAETSPDEIIVTLFSEGGPSSLDPKDYYGKEVLIIFKCKLDPDEDLSSYDKIVNVANITIDDTTYTVEDNNEATITCDLDTADGGDNETRVVATGDEAYLGANAILLISALAALLIIRRRKTS